MFPSQVSRREQWALWYKNSMRRRLAVGFTLLAVALAGCGSSGGDDNAATSSTGADASGTTVNLRDVDVCSFLSTGAVRSLTGESERFIAQQRDQGCFWAVPKAGFPAYVEILLARQPGGLDALTYRAGKCAVAPIEGLGEDAEGATCTPEPQKKVYVRAFDGEVVATVLVNAPKRALTPSDLVATARAVLDRL